MNRESRFTCPANLLDKARSGSPVRTAVAGAGATVPMESARMAAGAGLIVPLLVGDREAIRDTARAIGWDIAGIEIVAASGEVEAAEKAVALVRGGVAAALMKGQVHTDALMRAVVARETGLRTGRRLSHVFHMTIPGHDRQLCITDAAINVLPSLEVKIDILRNVIELMHGLGHALPKVALLSGAEVPMAAMPSSMDAAAIAERAGEFPDALIDGPLGFDNAVSKEAAAIKGVESPVAGDADVLLVPNLESGNFLFKQMVHFMDAVAAGIVMGAVAPIILTSRADPPEARLAAAAIASILADRAATK